jgi:hypothetical protein
MRLIFDHQSHSHSFPSQRALLLSVGVLDLLAAFEQTRPLSPELTGQTK